MNYFQLACVLMLILPHELALNLKRGTRRLNFTGPTHLSLPIFQTALHITEAFLSFFLSLKLSEHIPVDLSILINTCRLGREFYT